MLSFAARITAILQVEYNLQDTSQVNHDRSIQIFTVFNYSTFFDSISNLPEETVPHFLNIGSKAREHINYHDLE
jgi:hypothetical protein